MSTYNESPQYWRYCDECGRELKREPYKGIFDRLTGEETKRVKVYCTQTEWYSFHVNTIYESDSLEPKELPF